MTSVKPRKVVVKFYFTDNTSNEATLTVKKGTMEEFIKSMAQGMAQNELLAFIEEEFTDTQLFVFRNNLKYIEFHPVPEKSCEEIETQP